MLLWCDFLSNNIWHIDMKNIVYLRMYIHISNNIGKWKRNQEIIKQKLIR